MYYRDIVTFRLCGSVESPVPLTRYDYRASVDGVGVVMADGSNFRKVVLDTLRPLLDHMLATGGEDDTKSLNTIASVSHSHLSVLSRCS